MSEGILKFDRTDEEADFKIALHAMDFALTCWELDQSLRSMLKHGHDTRTGQEIPKKGVDAVQLIRTILYDLLESKYISLEMIE